MARWELTFQNNDGLDLSGGTKTVTIAVYSTSATDILAKVTNGGTDSATDASHGGTGWEDLTFDFAVAKDNTAAADAVYTNMIFYPAWNNEGGSCSNGCYAGSTATSTPAMTIYIDDIRGIVASGDTCANGVQDGDETGVDCGGSCPNACPAAPTDAPAAPTANAASVTSLYSDAYTDVDSNTTPGWSEVVTEEVHASNNVYRTTNFLPFALSSTIDITPYTTMHVDVWLENLPSAGAGLLIKILDAANGPHEGNYTHPLGSLTAGSWNSIDIPISSFVQVNGTWDATAQSQVDQVLVDIVDDAIMFVDNVYFYDNTASTSENSIFLSKVYPNPASDAWTISTPNNTIKTVEVFNVLGKQVISMRVNDNITNVPVTSLASGIYLAKVTTEAGTKTIKLIRE